MTDQSPSDQSLSYRPGADQPSTAARIDIELLYLDLGHCGRCQGAQAALKAAVEATRPALAAMGVSTVVVEKHVTSPTQAREEGFVASPTIRIDGFDVQPAAFQNRCRECGDLCGCSDGVDCRVWSWSGALHTEPPVPMLAGAILDRALEASRSAGAVASDTAATSDTDETSDGQANLKRFFDGRTAQDACCSAGCCA